MKTIYKAAEGLYEEPTRSLFYRKSLSLRRFYENCDLPVYQGKTLYPSGKASKPDYWGGLAIDLEQLETHDAVLAAQVRADFCKAKSSVPKDHIVGGDMYTHSMPNYERVLKEGLSSYIPRIQKIKDIDLREGLLHLVEGIETYINRCLVYLLTIGAEKRLIDALKKVPMNPAENIYEAVVAWNFVMYLDGCDNLGCVAAGLLPYHQGEDITELLKDLYDNLDVNEGWSMALGTNCGTLTVQCLEASKGMRRPMIELFVDEETPDAVWEKAFEVIRTCNGQPAFYNPEGLLGGLKRRFPKITDEDIKNFCGGGCTETMLAGLSNVGSLDAGINLALLLEKTVKEDLPAVTSFELFYDRYIDVVWETVEKVTKEISNSQKERAVYTPLPMRTLLVDDCIDKGLDFNNGGARYAWSVVNFAGLINVIDAMLVIRDFVFTDNILTAWDLIDRLERNDKAFLSAAKAHSVSYGADDPDANAFAKKLSSDLYRLLDEPKPYFGEGFLPASIQFMCQAEAGAVVGATPDGREAGTPLCDSLGAIFGKDKKGPTALLNSVTSLNLERALGVPVLNFNINPNFKAPILKALILGYMKQGGLQMQITCVSRKILEEAYKNPEDHKNLVVRVGGYSEYFYRLSDELKRMIIDRTIQEEV